MSQRLHVDPPAPPPFWQSEPIVEAQSQEFDSNSNSIIYAVIAGLCCLVIPIAIILLRRRLRVDTRFEERRLRAILAQNANIGPDAAWLSASAIAARLTEKAVAADESTLRNLERLKAIEMQRFGPGLAE